MKAITWPKYGPPEVLQYREVEKPTPKDNEVLIKVQAATVTAGDCELRRFDIEPAFWLPVRLMMGLRKPKVSILGQELSGEIEAVGKDVTLFSPGDAVFVAADQTLGAYAEYKCKTVHKGIALKPTHFSFEEAATLPTGGLNALYFLNKANLQPGERLLINGAGGSIGTYALQIAKSRGAEVVVVDNAAKLDMLRDLGADGAIDYEKQDFTKVDETYDVIFDVVGSAKIGPCLKALRHGGRLVLAHPRIGRLLRGALVGMTSDKKVYSGLATERNEDLLALKALAEEGILKPVIDKRFELKDMTAAHHYVESNAKAGNVIIKIGDQT